MVDTFAEQRMRDVTTMAMEMDEDAEEDLRDLDRMFLKIDANNDGTLTFDELLEGAMRVREFQNRLRVMDIDQNDLQQLFLMLDRDGGGTIDPDEFKKDAVRDGLLGCCREIETLDVLSSDSRSVFLGSFFV